jgi:hypothetical protein
MAGSSGSLDAALLAGWRCSKKEKLISPFLLRFDMFFGSD